MKKFLIVLLYLTLFSILIGTNSFAQNTNILTIDPKEKITPTNNMIYDMDHPFTDDNEDEIIDKSNITDNKETKVTGNNIVSGNYLYSIEIPTSNAIDIDTPVTINTSEQDITSTGNVTTDIKTIDIRYEIQNIKLVKYLENNVDIRSVTLNEEIKVSQNINFRISFNANFEGINIPDIYLNDDLIEKNNNSINITSPNVFEIILKSLPLKEGLNRIKINIPKNYNELVFNFDGTSPSLNIISPVKDIHVVNEPTILVEGITEAEAKVTVAGLPFDVDAFGNFRGNLSLKPGKNVILIETQDEYGNKTSKHKIVDYEKEFPILDFIAPTSDIWLKKDESFVFELTVKDAQDDISPDARPYLTANENPIDAQFISYDPQNKKITGICSLQDKHLSSLINFSVCIKDKKGNIGKNSLVLKIDNSFPAFSGLSFDGKVKADELLLGQKSSAFYSEHPIQKFYIDLIDEDSGMDFENSVFCLKTDKGENVTLNIVNKNIDIKDENSLLELNTLEHLDYGIYNLYISARDNVGNVSPTINIILVFGEEYLETIKTQSNGASFVISNALNYPNPCNSTGTNISFYSTTSPVEVKIEIYSVSGELVRSIDLGTTNAAADGFISTFWNLQDDWAQTVPNGVYLYRILATDTQETKLLKGKIAVLK